ncbi:UNVERIFIED_CONTAM: chitin deacetylase [Siphonaria sp. JEL0065]|nr:chitin deacetylase [Siphonaria sp. JEL0065]
MLITRVPLILTVSIASVYAYDFSWAPQWSPGVVAPGVPAWTSHFAGQDGSYSSDITSCYAGETNVWGATFDDGPGVDTGVVLNYFSGKGMHATFWVIGANILGLPDTLAATFAAGHNIGTHTWSHPDLTGLSADQVVAELVYGARAIYEVTGIAPKYFRPPYGSLNDNVRQIAAGLGLHAVTWSQDSADWSYVGTGNMGNVPAAFQNWMNQGLDAKISLEHDYYPETANAVPRAMDIVIGSGKRIVPFSECIGDSNVHNNPILTAFFQRGGLFEQYATGKPQPAPSPAQPQSNPSLSCQQDFSFGTDYWGNYGCIWNKSCPLGGSWSVADKKCNCLPSTPVWDSAAFECRSEDQPVPQPQPNPSSSCQQEFSLGTDYWGNYGCIWNKSCPSGGSWSVVDSKCDCLPGTPVWDNAAFKCKTASSDNDEAAPVIPSSFNAVPIVLICGAVVVGAVGLSAMVCIVSRKMRDSKKLMREELGTCDTDEKEGFMSASL